MGQWGQELHYGGLETLPAHVSATRSLPLASLCLVWNRREQHCPSLELTVNGDAVICQRQAQASGPTLAAATCRESVIGEGQVCLLSGTAVQL